MPSQCKVIIKYRKFKLQRLDAMQKIFLFLCSIMIILSGLSSSAKSVTMKEKITIDYLKNHPEHVITCAQWSFGQWGHHTPERTLQSFIQSRKAYLNDTSIPFTLLAFIDQAPIGMVSLAPSKDICHDLMPWLSTIYVTPEQRSKGIGTLLEETICTKALDMGYKKIYCYTSDKTVIPWYEKLNWKKNSTQWLHNHEVTVMEKNLIVSSKGTSMKTIGLLGGTGWSSTIGYYTQLNEKVGNRLGGYHSAKIILSSIDYHDIMNNYGKDHEATTAALKRELQKLIALKPDCIIICCNSLHKYYDMIKADLHSDIHVFHAVELVAEHASKQNYNKVLLLATRFTMEDGFFSRKLENNGIEVVIPNQEERIQMQAIHGQLMQNAVTQQARDYFKDIIAKYSDCQAVVLGCTEYPLVVDQSNSVLPIIDPVQLQTSAAVDFSLDDKTA